MLLETLFTGLLEIDFCLLLSRGLLRVVCFEHLDDFFVGFFDVIGGLLDFILFVLDFMDEITFFVIEAGGEGIKGYFWFARWSCSISFSALRFSYLSLISGEAVTGGGWFMEEVYPALLAFEEDENTCFSSKLTQSCSDYLSGLRILKT